MISFKKAVENYERKLDLSALKNLKRAVNKQIIDSSYRIGKEFDGLSKSDFESANDYESYIHVLEGDYQELDSLEDICGELLIVGLYKAIEAKRGALLKKYIQNVDEQKIYKIDYVKEVCPFIETLPGYSETDMIRIINNDIKHNESRVSEMLEKISSYHKGDKLKELSKVFEDKKSGCEGFVASLAETLQKLQKK